MAEGILDTLSNQVLQAEQRGIKLLTRGQEGNVTIQLQDGTLLNDHLPKGYTICHAENISPQVRMFSVWVDAEKMDNVYYQAGLAHEFGHLLSDHEDQLAHEEFMLGHETMQSRFKHMPLMDRIDNLTKTFRVHMVREMEAWDVGKPIADLMGVQDDVYDDFMTDGINAHYSSHLDFLASEIEEYCPDIQPGSILTVFNPSASETIPMTYASFQEKAKKMEELNSKSVKSLNQKMGIPTNRNIISTPVSQNSIPPENTPISKPIHYETLLE